jgi:hypothetical protein
MIRSMIVGREGMICDSNLTDNTSVSIVEWVEDSDRTGWTEESYTDLSPSADNSQRVDFTRESSVFIRSIS